MRLFSEGKMCEGLDGHVPSVLPDVLSGELTGSRIGLPALQQCKEEMLKLRPSPMQPLPT